jgi:holo-[acyl-carrier protein] synthase
VHPKLYGTVVSERRRRTRRDDGGHRVVGLGVDLVEVGRFAKTLERTPRVAQRLFAAGELAYAGRFSGTGRVERLAVRFAAKEAAMKALGVGLGAFGFHDVEVLRSEAGVPSLAVRGAAAELAGAAGVDEWLVSLSHTATLAQATVVALAAT